MGKVEWTFVQSTFAAISDVAGALSFAEVVTEFFQAWLIKTVLVPVKSICQYGPQWDSFHVSI